MKGSKILSIFYLILSIVVIFFVQEMFLTVVLNHFGQKGTGYNVSIDNTNSTIKYQYFNKFLEKEIIAVRTIDADPVREKFSTKKNITIYYTEQYPFRPRIDGLNDFSAFISSFVPLLGAIVVFIISLKELLFKSKHNTISAATLPKK
jgi:hypothetical protein